MTTGADPSLGPGPWGVYVHVPWCRRRCPYCSFYVEVDRGPDHATFVDAILRELDEQRPAFDALGPPSTLFFGGGTPSRLPAEQIARIVRAVGAIPDAEIALEANPEDLTPEVLAGLREAGIDRLSIGLQTFNPAYARLLNRASSVAQARAALERVRRADFRSYSVDLIFGLPDQSPADLDVDLDALLEHRPPHVSLYGLTFEPGTPFARAQARGTLRPPPDEVWRVMADRIHERLEGAGLRRYEVSNYAVPGHESRHNRLYWGDRPYLGLGPSAHGYLPDGRRTANVADLARWQRSAAEHRQVERPDPWQGATDLLVSGLRGLAGVERTRLRRRTSLDVSADATESLIRAGLLASEPGVLRLTPQGFPVADGVVERLVGNLRPA